MGTQAAMRFRTGKTSGMPEPTGPADAPDRPDMPSEPASWQGELTLVPLPGETGRAETDIGFARNGRKRKSHCR